MVVMEQNVMKFKEYEYLGVKNPYWQSSPGHDSVRFNHFIRYLNVDPAFIFSQL